MKKNKKFEPSLIPPREDFFGVPAEELEKKYGVTPEVLETLYVLSNNRDFFIVHKSSKKGQTSFRVTKGLLESLIETSIKIQKQPKLVLTIAGEYILTCSLTKAR